MAPGRVNVIGEHTDYNNGFVLPFALENAVFVAASLRSDESIVVSSRQLGTSSFALSDLGQASARLSHAESAIKETRNELGALAGVNLVVDSTVGVMDPMVSMCGKAEHALFLDCQTLDIELIPFRVSVGDSPTVMVIDTRTPRRLTGGEYSDRRRACQAGAVALGVGALRDATLESLQQHRRSLNDVERRRARHVITEITRVLAAVNAMRGDDFEALGKLLSESHRSLADDFEVITPNSTRQLRRRSPPAPTGRG
jgi:galactokinase